MYHRRMTTVIDALEGEVLPEGGAPLGPESLTWQYFADTRMLLLGPRAAVLQNMLPSLGQGVEEHSVWFAETVARLKRSIPPIYNTVFGTDPHTSGRGVRDFHTSIKGKLPEEYGGRPYSALNPDTYYWAHATFVDHLIAATDTFIRRLSEEEKDQLVAESVTWYHRYGVSEPADMPRTYAEFRAYWDRQFDERLVKHRTAAYGVGYATKGWPRPKQIPAPVWAVVSYPVDKASAFVTIGGMPGEAREILDLPWSEGQERRYRRFAAGVRTLNPIIGRIPKPVLLHPIAARAFKRERG